MRTQPFFDRVVLRREELRAARYPLTVPAVQQIEDLRFSPGLTILAGENGSGKSTLLEGIAIASGFNAEGGTKGFQTALRTGEDDLANALTLDRNPGREQGGCFFRAESMYAMTNYIQSIEQPGYGRLHAQSHGESFFAVFQNRFPEHTSADCLFFFDEIESALSPSRQLQLLVMMRNYIRVGCQFIVSTHSPILMSFPGADLYWLDGEGVTKKDWKETDHFRIYEAFIRRSDLMLDELLKE